MLSIKSSLAVLSFLLGGSTLNSAGLNGGRDLVARWLLAIDISRERVGANLDDNFDSNQSNTL